MEYSEKQRNSSEKLKTQAKNSKTQAKNSRFRQIHLVYLPKIGRKKAWYRAKVKKYFHVTTSSFHWSLTSGAGLTPVLTSTASSISWMALTNLAAGLALDPWPFPPSSASRCSRYILMSSSGMKAWSWVPKKRTHCIVSSECWKKMLVKLVKPENALTEKHIFYQQML